MVRGGPQEMRMIRMLVNETRQRPWILPLLILWGIIWGLGFICRFLVGSMGYVIFGPLR